MMATKRHKGRKFRFSSLLLMTVLCLAIVLASGCASPQMKGTPFYTGEYEMSWGPVEDRINLWPLLYYREPALSILWPLVELTGDHFAFRPLLSGYSSDGKSRNINALLGLFSNSWGSEQGSRGHLMPLYYYESDKVFYTALFGWNRDENKGFVYPLTPLAGKWTGDYSGGWLFPLFSYERHRRTGSVSGTVLWGQYWWGGRHRGSRIFPIYSYRNIDWIDSMQWEGGRYRSCGKEFWSLPACWYCNKLEVRTDSKARTEGDKNATVSIYVKRHGFFPLWSYSSERAVDGSKEEVTGRLLLALYDYKYKMKPLEEGSKEVHDYTRTRVLWRLWHYEHSNDDVSVDIFPAITYDRKKDGFKKISFLWRFFRYERDRSGKKLDLLFLPVMKARGRTNE